MSFSPQRWLDEQRDSRRLRTLASLNFGHGPRMCLGNPSDRNRQKTSSERWKNKKVKVAHTRLPSVRFWNGSRFLAVSLQVA